MKNRLCRLLFCTILGVLTLPADAETGRGQAGTQALEHQADAPRIGLIWWPADPANPANPFIQSLEECMTEQLAANCPGSVFVPPRTTRDALFPLLEPATQPESEEAFAALLARDDIRPRLMKRMEYLVAFSGGTSAEANGGILCGAGYGGGGCLGLAWINKDTRISVVIWDLDGTAPASHQNSRIKGTTWIPAFLLPVPIPALTEAEACRDMSRRIIEFIRPRPHGEACR